MLDLTKREGLSEEEKIKLLIQYRESGDKKIKNKIILEFMPMAMNLASKLSDGDADLLMDMYQESFLIIDKFLDIYEIGRSSLNTFIYTTLYMTLKKYKRNYKSIVKYIDRHSKFMKDNNILINYSSIELMNEVDFLKDSEDIVVKYFDLIMKNFNSKRVRNLLKEIVGEDEFNKLYDYWIRNNSKKNKK
ncbi:MAG: hypothetical protein QXW35_03510 [Candidatus Aenigmatarchaeota archaeon]